MEIGIQQTGEQPVAVGVKASACVVLATSGGKVGSGPSHPPPREGEHWKATAKTDIIQDF